jgi:EAL domain-containing protein (putative c-di-GMP-specific phosphodiesterase class I)
MGWWWHAQLACRARHGIAPQFIPLAEETGLILAQHLCVARSLQLVQQWQRKNPNFEALTVSVTCRASSSRSRV